MKKLFWPEKRVLPRVLSGIFFNGRIVDDGDDEKTSARCNWQRFSKPHSFSAGKHPFFKGEHPFLRQNTFFIRGASFSILLPELFWGEEGAQVFGREHPYPN